MAVTTAKASMSDQWLDGKGEMSDEEPATPAEVKAIKEFLCGLVAPSIAAKRLMDPREDEKHLDDKLNRIAWLIMDCILHYQAQQTLLIDLLDAIHHLADDELNFTAKQKLEHPDWRTWKYLGRFELLVDETLRSSEAYRFSLDDEDEDPRDAIRRWASLNSFMAHRCVHEKANDLLVYGVDLIEKTVEQGFANEGQRGPIDTGILDVDMPAVAQWLNIAGGEIYASLTKGMQWKSSNPDQHRRVEIGKEHWDLWKERLDFIQKHDALHSETRLLARQARGEMRIQEGTWS